jgi:MioC protein
MKTHDYTDRIWGHDFIFRPIDVEGRNATMMGWGKGLEKGDYMILPNQGTTTRYKITAVEYFRDPPDMWKASVEFAPRSAPVKKIS